VQIDISPRKGWITFSFQKGEQTRLKKRICYHSIFFNLTDSSILYSSVEIIYRLDYRHSIINYFDS
jgi:hypothetical protein